MRWMDIYLIGSNKEIIMRIKTLLIAASVFGFVINSYADVTTSIAGFSQQESIKQTQLNSHGSFCQQHPKACAKSAIRCKIRKCKISIEEYCKKKPGFADCSK